jgi:hypothetical protein
MQCPFKGQREDAFAQAMIVIYALPVALMFGGLLVVVALLTDSWKFGAGLIILAWILIAVLWIDHARFMALRPGSGPGDVFGLAFGYMLTAGVALTTAFYVLFMAWLLHRVRMNRRRNRALEGSP